MSLETLTHEINGLVCEIISFGVKFLENKRCHLHPGVGEQESIIQVDIKRESSKNCLKKKKTKPQSQN